MILRIEGIIKDNNLTAKDFAEILGVQQSKITDWRKGKTKPTISDIIGISQKFNVSTDYLLLGDKSTTSLSNREELLVKWFRECNDKGKDLIIEHADMVKDKYKKADTISGMENIVG